MMTDVGVQHDSGGSVDALAAVYREHYATLVGLARLLLDERGLAEEVVQEAFARTYAGVAAAADARRPAAVCAARGRQPGPGRSAAADRGAPGDGRPRPPDAPSAEDGVLAAARDREVADAVRALPRRQRECVVLRYFLDCSTAETADALGVSDGTVKQHLHRALAALGVALAEDQRARARGGGRMNTDELRDALRADADAPVGRGTWDTVQAHGAQIRRRRRGAQGAVAIVSVVVIAAGALALDGHVLDGGGEHDAVSSRPRRVLCPTRSSPA